MYVLTASSLIPEEILHANQCLYLVKYLFTTNAGSNTLSVFTIDPRDPLHPRLIGKPAATLGHIPVSVAYSQRLNTGMLSFEMAYSDYLLTLNSMRCQRRV